MGDSESTEMYIKTIFELDGGDEQVAISRIAERLGVSTVSATEMMKRLGERNLLVHTPYKGVQLTAVGRRRALNVLRRHRLWECFLMDQLDIPWEKTHEYACQLEHSTADEVADSLAAFLGNPATCPHGNPIPTAEGELADLHDVPLSEMEVGAAGRIARIFREETTLLEYLGERGLYPGMPLRVEDIAPYNGPMTLLVDGTEHILGRGIAAHIWIDLD